MASGLKRKIKQETGPFAYSQQVESDLRAAGWLPIRERNTPVYETAYQDEGVSLLPATHDFLRRYGGRVIRYEDQSKNLDILEFCADDAVRGMGGGGLRQVERLLDVRPLCPIGHYQYGTCMLLQDETGRVFGVSDDTTVFLGDSGEEAIENILSGREPQLLRSEILPGAGPKRSRGRKGDDRRSLPVVADQRRSGSDRVLQPIMPLDLPVKVRSWKLTVYPRSDTRRWLGVTRPAKA